MSPSEVIEAFQQDLPKAGDKRRISRHRKRHAAGQIAAAMPVVHNQKTYTARCKRLVQELMAVCRVTIHYLCYTKHASTFNKEFGVWQTHRQRVPYGMVVVLKSKDADSVLLGTSVCSIKDLNKHRYNRYHGFARAVTQARDVTEKTLRQWAKLDGPDSVVLADHEFCPDFYQQFPYSARVGVRDLIHTLYGTPAETPTHESSPV